MCHKPLWDKGLQSWTGISDASTLYFCSENAILMPTSNTKLNVG